MGDQAKSSKKNLAEMSREELIEKCKALLSLAQKAKAAKDGKYSQAPMKDFSQGIKCRTPTNAVLCKTT